MTPLSCNPWSVTQHALCPWYFVISTIRDNVISTIKDNVADTQAPLSLTVKPEITLQNTHTSLDYIMHSHCIVTSVLDSSQAHNYIQTTETLSNASLNRAGTVYRYCNVLSIYVLNIHIDMS